MRIVFTERVRLPPATIQTIAAQVETLFITSIAKKHLTLNQRVDTPGKHKQHINDRSIRQFLVIS